MEVLGNIMMFACCGVLEIEKNLFDNDLECVLGWKLEEQIFWLVTFPTMEQKSARYHMFKQTGRSS